MQNYETLWPSLCVSAIPVTYSLRHKKKGTHHIDCPCFIKKTSLLKALSKWKDSKMVVKLYISATSLIARSGRIYATVIAISPEDATRYDSHSHTA